MVEVLMSAVVGELSAWQTKWETSGQTFFYKYKDKDKDKDRFYDVLKRLSIQDCDNLILTTLFLRQFDDCQILFNLQ